ncbi:MAG: hypothetical protein HY676_04870 [Chloroflexi bacterium]|nr:hypothetical protein [Chloroflexota bacterium]
MEALRRLRRPSPKPVNLTPASTFEAILEERIQGLAHQVDELKSRVNGLVFVVVGAVVVQIVLGLVKGQLWL